MTRGVARLWVLGAVRRPLRAVVVVIALAVISTATIAALVAADSLANVFSRDAKAEWAGVDVEGTPVGSGVLDDSFARYLVSKAGPFAVAGAPRLELGASVSSDEKEERGLALGLGAEEAAFPALTAVAGIFDPSRLPADGAIVNARLARRLDLRLGSPLHVVVAVPEWLEFRSNSATPDRHAASSATLDLHVAGVVADSGTADVHRTPNVLIERSVLQHATDLEGKSTVVDFAVDHPGRGPAKDLIDELDSVTTHAGVVLSPVQADAFDTASGEGGLFRSILLTLALLVIAAAIGGAVDLMLGLVRGRGPEVAYLRAAGATRRMIERAITAEATVYGVVGVIIGVVAGIPFARLLATSLSDHIASLNEGRGREQVAFATDVRPITVVIGACVVLAAAAYAGNRAARRVVMVEPDVLLRDPAAEVVLRRQGSRRAVWLLAFGAMALGAGAAGGRVLVYLGLTLLLASLWVWRRGLSVDVARFDRYAAALGLLWAIGGAAAIGDFAHGVQSGFGVITIAAELAVVCACVLLLPHLRAVMRVVRGYVRRGPAQLAMLVAGAAAERQRRRSGIAMGVIAGAVVGIAALTILGNAAALPVDRQSGGFTAVGTSVVGVDAKRLQAAAPGTSVVALPHVDLPERGYRVEDVGGHRLSVPYPVRLAAAQPDFVAAQRYGLAASLPAYRNAREALLAVIEDGDKAVVDRYSRPEGAEPGDDVVIDTGAGPRHFRLVAVLDTFLLNAVFVGESPMRDIVAPRGDTMVFIQGGTGETTRAALERAGRSDGLELKTVQKAAADVVRVNRVFTDVFAVMLALTLAIGVAAMGAGVVRDGRERRGELGVLRAQGARRRDIAVVLAAEPTMVAGIGAVAGAVAGVVVLWVLFSTGFSDLPFVFHPLQLVGLVAGVVVLTGLSCVGAALPAARRIGADALTDLG